MTDIFNLSADLSSECKEKAMFVGSKPLSVAAVLCCPFTLATPTAIAPAYILASGHDTVTLLSPIVMLAGELVSLFRVTDVESGDGCWNPDGIDPTNAGGVALLSLLFVGDPPVGDKLPD